MSENRTVILAAGGTGGHLFPAEALASELTQRGYDVYLATDIRGRRFVRYFSEDRIHLIDSATIGSKNPFNFAKSLWHLFKGLRQSRQMVATLRPVLMGGFGGYPSLPPLWAAASMGVPFFVHEQNAVMGRANRFMARRAAAIAGGFLPKAGPYANKIVLTGNPLRLAVLTAADVPYIPCKAGEVFRLVVFGGSQGSTYFTQTMPAALAFLPAAMRVRLSLTLQARGESGALRTKLAALGVSADIAPFFDDMAERLASAHFVVARAGASTVAELATIGRPALLVPYPYALDHDQASNAAQLAQKGGALVVEEADLSAKALSEYIAFAYHNPDVLQAKAACAKEIGTPHAARYLANMAEALINGVDMQSFKQELGHEDAA